MPPRQGRIKLLTEEQKEKYVGDVNNIIFRSSWELHFAQFLLNSKAINKFSSEEIKIQYYNPVKKRKARYYMDFWAIINRNDGEHREILVEVKPLDQTQPPKLKTQNRAPTPKQKLNFKNQILTYVVNMAKWGATVNYVDIHNMCIFFKTLKRDNIPLSVVINDYPTVKTKFPTITNEQFHKYVDLIYKRNFIDKYKYEMEFYLLTENPINKSRYKIWKWDKLLRFDERANQITRSQN